MTKSNVSRKTFVQPDLPAGEQLVLLINGVKYSFRWCPPGTFMMGSPASEKKREDFETQHQVTLTRGFWMLETQVTQKMWHSIMGSNPSHFKGMKRPVERVNWNDCQEYIQKLNDTAIVPANYHFSLPSEAQWEYACRAGTKTPFHFGRTLYGKEANCGCGYPTMSRGEYLNEATELGKKTMKVGSFPANAWGLYDMHGNVYEWCVDRLVDYPEGSVTDPKNESSPKYLDAVVRGGSWYNGAQYCRSASRSTSSKGTPARFDAGLRLALVFDE